MTTDRGLLADFGRRNYFTFAAHGVDEILHVRLHGVVVVARQIRGELLTGGDVRGRFAAELLREELQLLSVQNLDGAFIAAELLAVAIILIPEIATVVDVELIGVLEMALNVSGTSRSSLASAQR